LGHGEAARGAGGVGGAAQVLTSGMAVLNNKGEQPRGASRLASRATFGATWGSRERAGQEVGVARTWG
jgi:hypothetical protein